MNSRDTSLKAASVFIICFGMVIIFLSFWYSQDKKREVAVEQVAELNLKVHHMLEYGDSGTYSLNDTLDYGYGHCGIYSYILFYKLKELGYDSLTIYVQSHYCRAIHVMIQCTIRGEDYVFDPSNGVYYKAGIDELINNPEVAEEVIYQINREETMQSYITENFLGGYIGQIFVLVLLCLMKKILLSISAHTCILFQKLREDIRLLLME